MGARTFEIQVNIEVKSCIVETSRLSSLTSFLKGVKEIAYFIACKLQLERLGSRLWVNK